MKPPYKTYTLHIFFIQDLDFTRELHNTRLRLYIRAAHIFSAIALNNFPLVFQPRKTLVTVRLQYSHINSIFMSRHARYFRTYFTSLFPDVFSLLLFSTIFLRFSSLTRLHEILQFSSLTRLIFLRFSSLTRYFRTYFTSLFPDVFSLLLPSTVFQPHKTLPKIWMYFISIYT
jgi:hypothetical protein